MVENPRGPVAVEGGGTARPARGARLQVHDEREGALPDVAAHVPDASPPRREAPLQGLPAAALRRPLRREMTALAVHEPTYKRVSLLG